MNSHQRGTQDISILQSDSEDTYSDDSFEEIEGYGATGRAPDRKPMNPFKLNLKLQMGADSDSSDDSEWDGVSELSVPNSKFCGSRFEDKYEITDSTILGEVSPDFASNNFHAGWRWDCQEMQIQKEWVIQL